MNQSHYITFVASLFICVSAVSQDNSRRQLGAHEHGHVIVNIAQDDTEVVIELESPAINIVGFEHTPKNNAQRHAVAEVRKTLEQADLLFEFPQNAACSLADVEVKSTLLDEHHDEDKAHEHDDESHGKDEHSEFHSRYRYVCANPDRLRYIEVRVFTQFSSIEQVRVNAVTASGQATSELTPDATRINFK